MIVYIAGPIKDMPDYNRDEFMRVQKMLEREGHTVFNPTSYIPNVNPEAVPYESYLQISMTMLHHCDAIYMLKGWRSSKGATAERAYAIASSIRVHYDEQRQD